MKDTLEQLKTLRANAAECQSIADLATDGNKRMLFRRLAEHMEATAAEIEISIKAMIQK